jgi:hypothetical protein
MLTDAEKWELLCWDERVKNARLMLGVCEGERQAAKHRIAAAHGIDPSRPYAFNADGWIEQEPAS